MQFCQYKFYLFWWIFLFKMLAFLKSTDKPSKDIPQLLAFLILWFGFLINTNDKNNTEWCFWGAGNMLFHQLLVFIDLIYISFPILHFKYVLYLFQEFIISIPWAFTECLLHCSSVLGAGDSEIHKTECLTLRTSKS